MPTIQTMGRVFRDRKLSADMSIPIFRAFGSALIPYIYSKPQADEHRRWQSTSGFLSSSPKFRLQPHYCTLAITKLLAVKNWPELKAASRRHSWHRLNKH